MLDVHVGMARQRLGDERLSISRWGAQGWLGEPNRGGVQGKSCQNNFILCTLSGTVREAALPQAYSQPAFTGLTQEPLSPVNTNLKMAELLQRAGVGQTDRGWGSTKGQGFAPSPPALGQQQPGCSVL